MDKQFLTIEVTEKSLVDKDWRAFCTCADERGLRWLLRGYGESPSLAAANAWNRYNEPTETWESFGYGIDTPCRKCHKMLGWEDLWAVSPEGPICDECDKGKRDSTETITITVSPAHARKSVFIGMNWTDVVGNTYYRPEYVLCKRIEGAGPAAFPLSQSVSMAVADAIRRVAEEMK